MLDRLKAESPLKTSVLGSPCGQALAALGVAAQLEAHGAVLELEPQPIVAPVLRGHDAEARRPDRLGADR